MMKRIGVIFAVIGVLFIGAYAFVRYSLSTPGFTPVQAKAGVARPSPPQSPLDLKPQLIQKLQQLVKQGSGGLYNLFIHEVKPDILNSSISISNALLTPDTAAIKQLKQTKDLPGEIFKIKTDFIKIDGLGISDILSKDVIDIKSIHILQPTIEVYLKGKANNQKTSSKTLYQRLMNEMKHIGIEKIIIEKGTLVIHHAKKSTRFNGIVVHLGDVRIDSTTQFDKNRFLFAKEAELAMKDYAVPTSNKLYTFKVGLISVSATEQVLVAKNVKLEPNYSKDKFQNHIQRQKERYDILIPAIIFKNTNWWDLINNETLQAESAEINKAEINVYLDRRKPAGRTGIQTFPHQLIMKLPLKINIENLAVNHLDLTYEEFSKLSDQTAKFFVTDLHGTVSNLTNLPDVIKKNHITTASATGTIMHVAPAHLTLRLDLANYKTGAFSADLKSDKPFDGSKMNSIAKPLGMFMIKRGILKELVSHVRGDNFKASGDVLMLYNNLHLTPMKKDSQDSGKLKKKDVISFIANTFVLKNENPSKNGEIRKEKASFDRGAGGFFNLIWKTTFVGILKTIGAPEKLASE